MAAKGIILLFIVMSVIISGCLSAEEDQEQERGSGGSSGGNQRPEEVATPQEIETEETGTPVGIVTQGEMGTPVETETEEEMKTSEEIETSVTGEESEEELTEAGIEVDEEAGAVQPAETEPELHLVRLRDYLFIPSSLKVNTGDTVVWRNFQESSVLILTSKEGLFEDQRLAYGNTMEYTFNEAGSYSFIVKGYPKMEMTITVK